MIICDTVCIYLCATGCKLYAGTHILTKPSHSFDNLTAMEPLTAVSPEDAGVAPSGSAAKKSHHSSENMAEVLIVATLPEYVQLSEQ